MKSATFRVPCSTFSSSRQRPARLSPFPRATVRNGQAAVPDYEHPMKIEDFRRNAHKVVDWICDYYATVESLPVRSSVKPGYLAPLLPPSPPDDGEPFDAVLSDINSAILPGVTHWQHPSFFAYFSANSSYPGMLGEFLSAAFNVIGFSWVGSPACTELEQRSLDWLAQLLGLPKAFLFSSGLGGGVVQGTASEAVLSAVLAAKVRKCGVPRAFYAQAGEGPDGSDTAAPSVPASRLVAYTSDQAHSCVKKACMIAGIENLRLIRARPEDDFALRPEDLEAQMRADVAAGLVPFFCTATLGTTSSAAVDPIEAVARVAASHGAWLHVDAAYAGSALVCEEFRHHAAGLDQCDSFCFNPHKWLLVNFDCSALWVRDRTPLVEALTLTPEFLRNKATDAGAVVDYKDWQIPLGRRFRALKLWMVMRTYGARGLREYIRHHVALARRLVGWVKEDGRFEVAAPVHFSLVCLRLKGPHGDRASALLLDRVNASGRVFLTHTSLGGRYVIRVAICGTNTQERHVREAWDLLASEAGAALSQAEAEATEAEAAGAAAAAVAGAGTR